ncbi:uncharacterized protein RSE6_10546 [Rhynchosporium secalis]|uniref:ATPase AAA-type core domain-containing protein n=1 Tax=Rhynchosporium secalis TaxID=38038 RepID=A0A1E1MKS8_RHYSE|nr:uncharacterized protein RSE6_10546 [Rhynchosporium secalis]
MAKSLTHPSTLEGASRSLAGGSSLSGNALGTVSFFRPDLNFLRAFFARWALAQRNDDLNYDIVEWIEKNVMEKWNPRVLVAKTATLSDHTLAYFDNERPDEEQAPSIKYVPTFERTGKEPLMVMVLGRSVAPIKRFLKTCHEVAEENRKATIAVVTTFFLSAYLSTFILKVYIPSLQKDAELMGLFGSLPSQCFVLLQDIDTVGMQRSSAIDEIEAERKQATKHLPHEERHASIRDKGNTTSPSNITLSGLLNCLDGLISQEGRIVIMTSNFAHKLEKALIRPGRIDCQVYLGYTSPPTLYPDRRAHTSRISSHLIIYRDSAAEAVKETKAWVTEHRRSKEEEQEWAKRASLWKAAQKGRILTPEAEDKATKNKDEP